MIPLRDENPSGSVARVTLGLIALNAALFAYEVTLGPELREFMMQWGLVPERLTLAVRFGEEPLVAPGLTVLTSMFLHGGWLHLIGNMWYLWIFGDNVEERLGSLKFLFFYLAGGVVSAATQYFAAPASEVPTVGASGAIAAVLGGYAVTFPRARVVTLIPFIFFFRIVPMPALLMLGLWFVLQLLSGGLSIGAGTRGGVAWWAHIGGFVFGALAMKVLDPGRRRRPASRAWTE